jgi:peptidoglycan hydrolase FlgJ
MSEPIFVPPALTLPGTPASAADLARRGQIKQTAQEFESSFLSVMMQQMFSGLSTDGPFGGGAGEEMFRSVLTDAMAKQMAKVGGIGIAPTVEREMLKLQGLK